MDNIAKAWLIHWTVRSGKDGSPVIYFPLAHPISHCAFLEKVTPENLASLIGAVGFHSLWKNTLDLLSVLRWNSFLKQRDFSPKNLNSGIVCSFLTFLRAPNFCTINIEKINLKCSNFCAFICSFISHHLVKVFASVSYNNKNTVSHDAQFVRKWLLWISCF